MNVERGPRLERGFTIVDNRFVRDNRLSLKTRGLLVFLLSQPDEWFERMASRGAGRLADALAVETGSGRDAIQSAINELATCGYWVAKRRQDPVSGKWTTETVVRAAPIDVPTPVDVGRRRAAPRIAKRRGGADVPIARESRKEIVLPTVPRGQNVLYRHFGADNEPLYVGVTRHFHARHKAHRRGSPWWPEVRSVTVVPYPDRTSVLVAEFHAIRDERPVHNKPAKWQPADPSLAQDGAW